MDTSLVVGDHLFEGEEVGPHQVLAPVLLIQQLCYLCLLEAVRLRIPSKILIEVPREVRVLDFMGEISDEELLAMASVCCAEALLLQRVVAHWEYAPVARSATIVDRAVRDEVDRVRKPIPLPRSMSILQGRLMHRRLPIGHKT